MADKEYYNETSNTVAGINTPKDREDDSPLDMIDDAVAEIVDRIKDDFDGGDNRNNKRRNPSTETRR